MSIGYSNCLACGVDTLGVLCGFCTEGAVHLGEDPEQAECVSKQTLAKWANTGKRLFATMSEEICAQCGMPSGPGTTHCFMDAAAKPRRCKYCKVRLKAGVTNHVCLTPQETEILMKNKEENFLQRLNRQKAEREARELRHTIQKETIARLESCFSNARQQNAEFMKNCPSATFDGEAVLRIGQHLFNQACHQAKRSFFEEYDK